jgi:4-hydroxyphenylpyruvate dioxygenase
VERKKLYGRFPTWLQGMEIRLQSEPTGLKYIDHMVGNVGWNEMNTWVKFYEEVMGFVNFLSLMTNKSIRIFSIDE